MHVSLTKQLENLIHKRVSSGMYNNASEVVREALRNYFNVSGENLTSQEVARIREVVGPRMEVLKNGTAKLMDADKAFDDIEYELRE